jgi:hypothetical protein
MADTKTPNRGANEDLQKGPADGVVNRRERGHDTPRRYDEPLEEPNVPVDEATGRSE